jgi:hypothetical protein
MDGFQTHPYKKNKYTHMKRIFFTCILVTSAVFAFGRNVATDTTKKHRDTTANDDDKLSLHYDRHHNSDTTRHHNAYPKAYVGITFSRFDLGLATLVDNGSFTLSPQNQFLRYRQWKTSNVGFDVFQMGVKLNHNFKIYHFARSAGFDL